MYNIALLSAAHTHTKGILNKVADRENTQLVALWDDVADRGQRFAKDNGAEYSADLKTRKFKEE